jgi:N-terminal domain of anti-restriction factor ArdC
MQTASFAELLQTAVTQSGTISTAYSAFHSYSLGNQLLAPGQCLQRGIQPGPLATFPRWKELGRHVVKGQRCPQHRWLSGVLHTAAHGSRVYMCAEERRRCSTRCRKGGPFPRSALCSLTGVCSSSQCETLWPTRSRRLQLKPSGTSTRRRLPGRVMPHGSPSGVTRTSNRSALRRMGNELHL